MSKTLRRCLECGKIAPSEEMYDMYSVASDAFFCTIAHAQKWMDRKVRE
jgi:hypothetical protein